MREKISQEMRGKNGNMSDFIAHAENIAPDYVELLKERKVKICNIIPEITLLNNQNVELLKHGIIISNKMSHTSITRLTSYESNSSIIIIYKSNWSLLTKILKC